MGIVDVSVSDVDVVSVVIDSDVNADVVNVSGSVVDVVSVGVGSAIVVRADSITAIVELSV